MILEQLGIAARTGKVVVPDEGCGKRARFTGAVGDRIEQRVRVA
jgi:hypothetical protein